MLSLVATQNLRENIFIDRHFNFDRQVFTPATRRKEIQQARMITERRKKEPAKPTTLKDLLNSRLRENADTTKKALPQKPRPPVQAGHHQSTEEKR